MTLLPTQRSQPKTLLSEFTIVAYGHPKIGKTTFASQFPDAIFLATESGHNALSVFKIDIDSWDKLLDACRELAEGKHPFKTVCIDTVDNLWALCRNHVCEKNKVAHESDLAYGKGHALILSEFQRVLTKLSMLPYGLVLVSHAAVQEIQTRTGPQHKVVPSLPDKPRKVLLGMADMILYFDQDLVRADDGKQTIRRVIRTQPSPNHEAGDRTGRLPEVLDLDYRKFSDAFARAAQGAPAAAAAPTTTTKKTQ